MTAVPALAFGDNYDRSLHGAGLHGISVTVNDMLCRNDKMVRPKRPHRRARVQKKWIRRYGWVMGGCTGHGYEMAGVGLVGCPHWVARLHAAVGAKP